MTAVPVKPALGTKRTRSVERSSRAGAGRAPPVGARVDQLAPASIENCQVPDVVPLRPTTAIPWRAPGPSGSVTAVPSSDETRSPGGVVLIGTSFRAGLRA